jgi:inner membrane protein
LDSLTQAVLGASVAAVCAPRANRRKALLVGAVLGTVPDMDVYIDYGDAVANFTYHRGFSHSLFVLFPFSVLLWWLLHRWWAPVRDAPIPWLAAISLTLITHPLLDAHTAYGTQLWWPLTVSPTMWSTLFIIDPIYTTPMLIGILAATLFPMKSIGTGLVRGGLVISTLYIGWSWTAKFIVENNAREALARIGQDSQPMFSTPTPLNTLLWRIVVLTDDGYLEGFDSLVIEEGDFRFDAYPSDNLALENAGDVWAVARLRWFSRDFLRSTIEDDRLVLSDLRMGHEPNYVFSHMVTRRSNPHWQALPTERIEFSFEDRALGATWRRIWAE